MELNCFSSALTSKACISDFMGYITAYGMGRLRIWKGTISAESYIQALK